MEIKKPGRYLLSNSLTYAGNGYAITISCDDVTLDLNGWTLTGTNGVANQTAGVYALSRSHITIRNGTVRGFFRGIYLEGTDGRSHLVQDLNVEDSLFLGIQVKGSASTVRHNRVTNVGGATAYTAERIGIDVIGDALQVVDNDVCNVSQNSGSEMAYGIRILNSGSSTISNNRVLNSYNLFPALGYGTYGIEISGCNACAIAGNQISSYATGLFFPDGTEHIYRDNTVIRATKAYSITNNAAAAGPNNTP